MFGILYIFILPQCSNDESVSAFFYHKIHKCITDGGSYQWSTWNSFSIICNRDRTEMVVMVADLFLLLCVLLSAKDDPKQVQVS